MKKAIVYTYNILPDRNLPAYRDNVPTHTRKKNVNSSYLLRSEDESFVIFITANEDCWSKEGKNEWQKLIVEHLMIERDGGSKHFCFRETDFINSLHISFPVENITCQKKQGSEIPLSIIPLSYEELERRAFPDLNSLDLTGIPDTHAEIKSQLELTKEKHEINQEIHKLKTIIGHLNEAERIRCNLKICRESTNCIDSRSFEMSLEELGKRQALINFKLEQLEKKAQNQEVAIPDNGIAIGASGNATDKVIVKNVDKNFVEIERFSAAQVAMRNTDRNPRAEHASSLIEQASRLRNSHLMNIDFKRSAAGMFRASSDLSEEDKIENSYSKIQGVMK